MMSMNPMQDPLDRQSGQQQPVQQQPVRQQPGQQQPVQQQPVQQQPVQQQPVQQQPAKPAARVYPLATKPGSYTPASPNLDSQLKYAHLITVNMLSTAAKRIMVSGDTGLGKTSFVKQFSKIFGLASIIVEIPHAVEEHLLNIPFMVFDKTGAATQDAVQIQTKGKDTVVQGVSYLASELKKIHKNPDAEYAATIKTYDPGTQELIKQFEESYPGQIAEVRARYDRILFLDEFYRQTSTSIRNILRNILGNRIGNDRMPKGTYVIYASNLEDVSGSMDQPMEHESYLLMPFTAPSKEQWLNYTVSNAINQKVQFKQEVIDAFDKILKDEHVSYNDVATGLRTSPRRWSEILLYINNSFPFSSPNEAGIVLTTIKRQFQDDEHNTSGIFHVVYDMLQDLCVKSNIDPRIIKELPATEWRDILAHNVITSLTLGKNKKYVPVVQGLPGVGKTAMMDTFEKAPYNLRTVHLMSTTIPRDDIIGFPLKDELPGGKIGITFSEPPLLIKIQNMMEESREDYQELLTTLEQAGQLQGRTASDVYQEWEQQKYKYIVFFDELNRVKDIGVFNSLRRLILEKEFNEQYKLPDDILMLAAMNPTGAGTQPMTSHFRDAIDLIDVAPSWKDTIDYIKNTRGPQLQKANKATATDTSLGIAFKIIEGFPAEFGSKPVKGRLGNQFYIALGEDEIYINPRDFDTMYTQIVQHAGEDLLAVSRALDAGEQLDKAEINGKLIDTALEHIKQTFDDRFYANGIEKNPPGFYRHVRQYLDGIIDVSLTKKTSNLGLAGILATIKDKPLADNFSFKMYMRSYMPAPFQQDFTRYLQSLPNPKQVDDLVYIAQSIADAVNKNSFEPDILDRVENAMFDHMKEQIADADRADTSYFEHVGKTYQAVLTALER